MQAAAARLADAHLLGDALIGLEFQLGQYSRQVHAWAEFRREYVHLQPERAEPCFDPEMAGRESSIRRALQIPVGLLRRGDEGRMARALELVGQAIRDLVHLAQHQHVHVLHRHVRDGAERARGNVLHEHKIGFLSTLSGPAGGIGNEIRDGFNLALKLAGGKLGALPTEVIFADDTLNPDTGKQLMERLLKRDRVNLVTGIVFSNVMLAVWPTIEESKIFYIAPNATPTSLTGKGCSPYFFSASWPNESHHEAAGAFAQSNGFKNAYLIAPNYPAGQDALTGFKRTYKGTIVNEFYSKLNQLDD